MTALREYVKDRLSRYPAIDCALHYDLRRWLREHPDRPSDLAAEAEWLRTGIEALDLDLLEDVAFNLGHTVYEATELEPAECTDECEACCIEDTVTRLRALLAGTR